MQPDRKQKLGFCQYSASAPRKWRVNARKNAKLCDSRCRLWVLLLEVFACSAERPRETRGTRGVYLTVERQTKSESSGSRCTA